MKILIIEPTIRRLAYRFEEIRETHKPGTIIKSNEAMRKVVFSNGDEIDFVIIGKNDEGLEKVMGINRCFDEVRSYRTNGSPEFKHYAIERPVMHKGLGS